jgi:antitoxin (DNA-binding transcriptional repressor) of toxin-antitoxin stability system
MSSPAVDLTSVPIRVQELVDEATREGEVVLTRGGEAVAKIIPLKPRREPRVPGVEPGLILHMADDFDATPEDFEDYV